MKIFEGPDCNARHNGHTTHPMKINLSTSALVAMLGIALAGAPVSVQAQTTNTAPAAAPADTSTAPKVKEKKKNDNISYSGSVTAISSSSITVTTAKGPLTLAIDSTTKFMKIGADKKKTPAASTDFAVGDKVTGSYKKADDGTMTAASVHKKS